MITNPEFQFHHNKVKTMEKHMSLLGRLRVSYAIALAVMLPVIAAIFFATNLVIRDNETVKGLENMTELVELSNRLSNLVDEQQKERGATAGFLGSHGAKFGQKLADQQRQTDTRLRDLENFVTGFEHKGVDAKFEGDFNALLAELARFDSIRSSVKMQSISITQAIGYYTSLNTQSLELIGHIANLSTDPRIVSTVLGYVNFLQPAPAPLPARAVNGTWGDF